MYIYKFTNINNGKCYIGQTIQDPNQRRLEHLSESRYSNKTYHFHNALRKYGIDGFTFEVIASAESLDELNKLEEEYVVKFNSIENGYNIRQPGGNKKHSPESIQRMREAQKLRHAKRREENGGVETINKKSGYKFKNPHPKKGKDSKKWSEEAKEKHRTTMQEVAKTRKPRSTPNDYSKGKTWKLINGKRVWLEVNQ
jgi:group I intron endonuclease